MVNSTTNERPEGVWMFLWAFLLFILPLASFFGVWLLISRDEEARRTAKQNPCGYEYHHPKHWDGGALIRL